MGVLVGFSVSHAEHVATERTLSRKFKLYEAYGTETVARKIMRAIKSGEPGDVANAAKAGAESYGGKPFGAMDTSSQEVIVREAAFVRGKKFGLAVWEALRCAYESKREKINHADMGKDSYNISLCYRDAADRGHHRSGCPGWIRR